MKSLTIGIVILVSSGCAHPTNTFARVAPANALECALRAATDSAFSPVAGGVSSGFVLLRRPDRTGMSKSDVGKETATRALTLGLKGATRPAINELTMTGANGQLRVTIIDRDDRDRQLDASEASIAVAQYVLNSCAPIAP